MQDARNLEVSEYAHRLAVATYRHTESFPSAERFGITSQMRRAAVSIASNIAEGCGRRSNRELLTFLHIAVGSGKELACQLRISTDLGYGDAASAKQLGSDCERVTKMLSRLITFLRNQPAWRQKEGRP
jgi:four helix bundle protein